VLIPKAVSITEPVECHYRVEEESFFQVVERVLVASCCYRRCIICSMSISAILPHRVRE
jgi:hypothetical protein